MAIAAWSLYDAFAGSPVTYQQVVVHLSAGICQTLSMRLHVILYGVELTGSCIRRTVCIGYYLLQLYEFH